MNQKEGKEEGHGLASCNLAQHSWQMSHGGGGGRKHPVTSYPTIGACTQRGELTLCTTSLCIIVRVKFWAFFPQLFGKISSQGPRALCTRKIPLSVTWDATLLAGNSATSMANQ